ncbi:hypothetical protein BO79DRAFT_241874 [Aspergillus costaricaensis CBS 115574]|uniref:Uncharacterized protein n=1 Tax=Aspergillus costaricaensis CBS 115574 TaxID=1448317 RepID=A0ACD1IVW9_9EURO|nr:hypothetical protein BO79DRAFT_241874 [Aspergillus costaricaensis CBS 115574]RAK94424.1 hypothetical protein BO79DRAFT_241874 [Aspergillus costaricaensis CBS 115574]
MKHLSQSGASNLGAALSMLILSILAVALRLVFRLQARQGLTLSDATMVLALVFTIAFYSLVINYTADGPGPGTWSIPQVLTNLENGGITWGVALLKVSYLSGVIFITAINITKLSILALYHTLFGISVPFKRFNWAMVGVVLFFWILFEFIFIFQCSPIPMFWNLAESATHCMSVTHILFAFEFTNFCVDVAMLVMPLVMIKNLNLPRAKKLSVSGILLLGGMVCIVSVVRLYFIWNPASIHFPRSLPAMEVASEVQLGVAIFCACLPTYAPVLKLFRSLWRSFGQRGSKKSFDYRMTPPSNRSHRDNDVPDLRFADNKTLIDSTGIRINSDPFGDSSGTDTQTLHMETDDHRGADAV